MVSQGRRGGVGIRTGQTRLQKINQGFVKGKRVRRKGRGAIGRGGEWVKQFEASGDGIRTLKRPKGYGRHTGNRAVS